MVSESWVKILYWSDGTWIFDEDFTEYYLNGKSDDYDYLLVRVDASEESIETEVQNAISWPKGEVI